MARVLIIKGGNFAANRVAQVEIESVPCTGITLSQNTLTATSMGDVTVSYTLTPSDTTDEVVWSSSDASVATASGTTVTIHGVGTCTLTATCGSASATLAVTATLGAAPDWCAASGSSNIITDSSDNSIIRVSGAATMSSRMFGAQFDNDFDLPILDGNSIYTVYPIEIPNNVTKIHVSATGVYNSGNKIIFASGNERVEYSGGTISCKAVSSVDLTASSNAIDQTVTIPEGADSFILDFRLKSAVSEGTTAAQAAVACNMQVEYLVN